MHNNDANDFRTFPPSTLPLSNFILSSSFCGNILFVRGLKKIF